MDLNKTPKQRGWKRVAHDREGSGGFASMPKAMGHAERDDRNLQLA